MSAKSDALAEAITASEMPSASELRAKPFIVGFLLVSACCGSVADQACTAPVSVVNCPDRGLPGAAGAGTLCHRHGGRLTGYAGGCPTLTGGEPDETIAVPGEVPGLHPRDRQGGDHLHLGGGDHRLPEGQVEADSRACFIATFDHLAHTRSLPEGEISPDILAAMNLVFCFGIKLPSPQVMAVRPRSIGVTELADRFVINFMEAPMPVANNAMEEWARSVRNRE